MREVFMNNQVPIKSWVSPENLEGGTFDQAMNLADLPFVHSHIALMADAHQGYGMPIGGVMALDNVIIPHAVGSDIGCGMRAVRTNLTEISAFDADRWQSMVQAIIPVGTVRYKKAANAIDMPFNIDTPVICKYFHDARFQLGTLGSGNHFIELQKGNDGFIWIMIHSGSRHIGYEVAKYWDLKAQNLHKRWHTTVPVKHELAFLPMGTEEGITYYQEMNWCVGYAKRNRAFIMGSVKNALYTLFPKTTFDDPIDIAHNYANWERHYGKIVLVHRKGATSADTGEIGIIPGSQGSRSFIVKGKGNRESFKSCSHGAGRCMGRKAAIRTLDLEEEQAKMINSGSFSTVTSKNKLEEAPGAYKDIEEVMANQADLVTIEVSLTPIKTVKG